MTQTKKLFLQIIVVLGLLISLAVPVTVSAQIDIPENIEKGACGNVPCPDGDPDSTVTNIISTVINIFSLVVGVVAVIMIIIGGFKYITSSGDSGNITSAKNTILYAIVGLVVVALSQIIVRFVLSETNDAVGS